ncbi:MAG: metallophosphoesterase, partial [Acetomicrobium sp.]|nr:metallophosphoesterase [Acetomicrobium sp.]
MGLGLMFFIGSVALIYFLANYYIYRHISPLCQSSLGKVVLIVLVLAMVA